MMEIHHNGPVPVAGNRTFPTTSTGEVGKVGKWTPKPHPHHHLLGGVGVWWGWEKFEIAGGENQGACYGPCSPLHLKMQAGCRPGNDPSNPSRRVPPGTPTRAVRLIDGAA